MYDIILGMDNKKENAKKELIVNTSTVIGSTYAQIARVTITDIEITIEFAYVHPADPTQGQSVARVTMPVKAGIDLANMIRMVEQTHEKRKKGKKND
jgi:Protein of unknown function (DUF3467)